MDTAGNLEELPGGPPTAEVLVPVSSIDGARGALQTIEDVRARLSGPRVTVVLNTIDAESAEDREYGQETEKLKERVRMVLEET